MPFRSNMLKLDIINNLRVNREALNNKRNRRTATILPVLNERMAFPFVVSPARLSCRRRPSKLVAAVQLSKQAGSVSPCLDGGDNGRSLDEDSGEPKSDWEPVIKWVGREYRPLFGTSGPSQEQVTLTAASCHL